MVPMTPRPATVAHPQFDAPVRHLTLNDAINIVLADSEVVRVFTGVTVTTSGRTIFDAPITNTTIEEQRAVFDPNLRFNNVWNQIELARLELQTGTILQEHNVVVFEERFRSIGPLGPCCKDGCYPRSLPPSASVVRYEGGDLPSEDYFDLEDPVEILDNQKSDPSEVDQDDNIDMDTDVEFQKIDDYQEGERSDEEIDEILDKRSAIRTFSDFLKLKMRR